MPFMLTMPKLSPTMTEGAIAKWHKKPGDFIESGDLLLEIATDKATIEHNALDPGWMRVIVVQEGEKAEVNQTLAILTNEKDEAIDEKALSQKETASTTKKEPQKKENKEVVVSIKNENRPIASPLAKKIAKEKGIHLEGIKGSGPRGRIMSRDIMLPDSSTQKPILPEKSSGKRVEMLSPMRQVIAKRLQESKSTIPHFYVSIDIRVDRLLAIREEMKQSGLSITINDFIVKATALALMDHQTLLTNFDPNSNSVTYFSHADIAIAVSIEGGLITPIVERAEEKSIIQLSQEIKNLAERAKKNKLLPNEFMGGAFTISNLGMFGVSSFQAIINPPQTAILAVGGIRSQAIIEKGIAVEGKIMQLTLSCDHRVVDGADGAKFLQTMQALLQNPLNILAR